MLVIVVIVASSNTDPPSEGVIFSDDFSGRAAAWTDAHGDSSSGYYNGDTYRIHSEPKPDGGGEWSSPRNAVGVYPSSPPNVRIDVEALRISGTTPHSYGILCRLDGVNFYALSAGEGFVSIEKYIEDDPYFFELAYELTAIDMSATNRLQASCTSDDEGQSVHLALSVNGSMIAEATDTDNPLAGGTVGLWAAMFPNTPDATEAEFDNFAITEL